MSIIENTIVERRKSVGTLRCPVYPIVNVDDIKDPKSYIETLLSAAVSIMQLRAKTSNTRDLLELAREVKPLCAQANCKLIINDRADICLLSNADGIHLGQDDLDPRAVRAILPEKIIGFSTHSLSQLNQAPVDVLDYLAIGPIFHSVTKSGHAPEVGLENLKLISEQSALPLIAIGGINTENAKTVFDAGASAIAVINDLQTADIPAAKIERYCEIFRTSQAAK